MSGAAVAEADPIPNQGNPKPRRVCGAQLRPPRTGPCQNWVALGKGGRCKMHGGASTGPKSVSLPAGGRYSRVLGRWRGAYEAALARADILDLKPTLALMDVAMEGLLADAEQGDLRAVKRLVSLLRERSKRAEAALKIELQAADMLTRREASAFVTMVTHTLVEVLDPASATKAIRAIEARLRMAGKHAPREVEVLPEKAEG